MVPCLLESVNNEERSLAIILSEPEKTSGSNDIIQEVASSLSQKFRSKGSVQNIHLSNFYHFIPFYSFKQIGVLLTACLQGWIFR